MTLHSKPRRARGRARSSVVRLLGAAILVAGASGWVASCSTVETVHYGDGDCVGAACQQAGASSSSGGTASTGSGGGGAGGSSSSSSSGGPCVVDDQCAVKWGADIFAGIIDTAAAGCTQASLCHGSGKGGITLEAGKPHDAYLAMTAYTLLDQPGPAKKYIVPCDKAASGILCNAKPETGTTNPYGACGSLMPLVGTNLTMAELNTIADWIACGAPEN